MSTSEQRHYIGGGLTASTGTETVTVVNPATEKEIGRVCDGTAADVDAAVRAARRALPGWSGRGASERAHLMERFADAIEAAGDRLAALVTSENGQPVSLSTAANVTAPAGQLRYYADLVRRIPQEAERPGSIGPVLVRREPVGVAGLIVPWNYPVGLIMMKLAPALAAGCTVVIKPAPETPFDALLLAELATEAGLPAGVVNVVTGGLTAGQALVEHPDVDKIAFTGSTAAGRTIGRACAERFRPVTLELGGKSAAIILDDADLAQAAQQLAFLCFANTGQSCYLNSRVLAPRSRYEEVVEMLRGLAGAFVLGDPTDPATTMGPLVTSRQRERVEAHVAAAIEDGARLVTGGARPADLAQGWYYAPTVFADVAPDSRLAQQEVFGPVVAVLPYDGDDEAVALANDTDYGLAGSVWTRDQERGLAVARRVHTGTIGVGGWMLENTAPFGGRKASGLGHELGPEGLDAYVALKSINVPAL
ncbi:aldehyde dehydrogenase [Streptomyces sp. NPDC001537]